jgi:hypothetical protein
MVTTKYCIDIRTKSKTCRQTENCYYEVFINTSIPRAKQRTKMVTTDVYYTCTPKTRLKTSQANKRKKVTTTC